MTGVPNRRDALERTRGSVGAVTAEFAIVLPAVATFLVVGIGAISIQAQQVQLTQQVGLIARLAEAGFTSDQLHARAGESGLRLKQTDKGDLTCFSATRSATLVGVGLIPLTSEACGLAPGK